MSAEKARDRRERATEVVARALSRDQCTRQVTQDGDRVTLRIGEDYVTIIIAECRPPVADDATACPFCGSSNIRTSSSSSDTEPRRGCLDCDQYLDPVRFKR